MGRGRKGKANSQVTLVLLAISQLLSLLAAQASDLVSPPAQIDVAQGVTLDEVREEIARQTWKKGDYSIVPYGALWGSAYYASGRCVPGPFILYAASATTEGEDDFVIDTRRTRIGLDITGPKVSCFSCAESAARLEVDFQAALGTAEGLRVFAPENQTGIQIRHAYAELKNDEFRLLAGQTWDLISPLNPGMLTYAVGWGGGNIGFRRMQVRYERYLHVSDGTKLSLQGAVAQDIALDFIQFAESSNWPVLQGRCGLDIDPEQTGRPLSLGISSHIGEQGFDFPGQGALPAQDDARIETWSLNADARWPITSRLGVQGEYFMGENLSTFLGGVIQGINAETRRPIASTGGWIELWYDWTPRFRSHLGYGIDNPRDSDVANLGRIENSVFFVNSSFDVLPKMTLGLEFSYWDTQYRGQAPGKASVIEFTGMYAF